MCFSAPASFAAAGVIGTGGVVTNMRRLAPTQRLYALIPVLFAIQQTIEGIQWLIINRTGSPNLIVGYAFVFFAFLLWPVYFPFSGYLVETNQRRQKVIFGFFLLGSVVSIGTLAALIANGLDVHLLTHSLVYGTNVSAPWMFIPALGAYVAATFGSLLFSSHKWIRVFGVVGILSLIVTLIVRLETFASVWCFCAAVLSALVFVQVRQFNQVKK